MWAAGDKGLVYSLANANWRTDNVRLHWLGKPRASDIELYHEPDEGFRVGASLSANEKWIVVSAGDHETSEVYLIPASDPLARPMLVRARQKGLEYAVDERDGALFIQANDAHENFRLATAPLAKPSEWTTLIEGSDLFYMTGFSLFRDFYVVEGRRHGLDQIELHYYDDPARVEPIRFPEASYTAGLSDNPEWAVTKLRLSYEIDGQPRHDLRLRRGRKDARNAQGSGNPLGLRRLEICHRAAGDSGARRHDDPGQPGHAQGPRCGQRRAGQCRSISMATAPTAWRWTPASRLCGSASSIAALPTPSPISGAAAVLAAPGTRQAS